MVQGTIVAAKPEICPSTRRVWASRALSSVRHFFPSRTRLLGGRDIRVFSTVSRPLRHFCDIQTEWRLPTCSVSHSFGTIYVYLMLFGRSEYCYQVQASP